MRKPSPAVSVPPVGDAFDTATELRTKTTSQLPSNGGDVQTELQEHRRNRSIEAGAGAPAAAASVPASDDNKSSKEFMTLAAEPWSTWGTGVVPAATARRYSKGDGEASMLSAIRSSAKNVAATASTTATTTDTDSAAETGGVMAPPQLPPPPPLARTRSRVLGSFSSGVGGRRPSTERISLATTAYAARATSDVQNVRDEKSGTIATAANMLHGSRQRTPKDGGYGHGSYQHRPPRASSSRGSSPRVSPPPSDNSSARQRKALQIPRLPDFGKKMVSPRLADAEISGVGGIENGVARRTSNSSIEVENVGVTPLSLNNVQPFTPMDTPEPGTWRTFLQAPSPAPLLLDPPPLRRRPWAGDAEGKGSFVEKSDETSVVEVKNNVWVSEKQEKGGRVRTKAGLDSRSSNAVWPLSAIKFDNEGSAAAASARKEEVETDRSATPCTGLGRSGSLADSMDLATREKAETAAIVARTYMIDKTKKQTSNSPGPAVSHVARGGNSDVWNVPKPAVTTRQRVFVLPAHNGKDLVPSITDVFPSPLGNGSDNIDGPVDSAADSGRDSPPILSEPRPPPEIQRVSSTVPVDVAVDADRCEHQRKHSRGLDVGCRTKAAPAANSFDEGPESVSPIKSTKTDVHGKDSKQGTDIWTSKNIGASRDGIERSRKTVVEKFGTHTVHISSLLSPPSSPYYGTSVAGVCSVSNGTVSASVGDGSGLSRAARSEGGKGQNPQGPREATLWEKDARVFYAQGGARSRDGEISPQGDRRAGIAGVSASGPGDNCEGSGEGHSSNAAGWHGGSTVWQRKSRTPSKKGSTGTGNRCSSTSPTENEDQEEPKQQPQQQHPSLVTAQARDKYSTDNVGTFGAGSRGSSASSSAPAVPLRTLVRNAARSTPNNGVIASFSDEALARCVTLRCAGTGVEVMARVMDFLDSDRKVFLLTGEAGSGKSRFAALLAHKLTAETAAPGSFLPIILDARETEGAQGAPLDSLVEHYFMRSLGFSRKDVGVVRNKQRLLIILDGFDRIPLTKRRNLWTMNGWANWRAKVLYTSRRSGLLGLTRPCEETFVPTDRRGLARHWALETAAIAPIAPEQVGEYVRKVEVNNAPAGGSLTELHALGTHPLTLGLAIEAVEAVFRRAGSVPSAYKFRCAGHPTRACVVAAWLEQKMVDEKRATVGSDGSEALSGILAAEEVAMSMFQAQRWTTDTAPDGSNAIYLSKIMAPLNNGLWAFTRSGILEYLVASQIRRQVLLTDRCAAGHPITDKGGSWIGSVPLHGGQYGINDTADRASSKVMVGPAGSGLVLAYLGEMCATDRLLTNRLLEIVDDSRKTDNAGIIVAMMGNKDHLSDSGAIEAAAANAMTILCRSGHSFAGRDLSRIRVPGAVMDGGVFDGCCFEGADLTGCSLENASLRRCNFSRAFCENLEVGALPTVRPLSVKNRCGEGGVRIITTRESLIERVQFSPDGTVLALLAADGRSAKILRTDSFTEVCAISPGDGRLFSPEVLEMSADCAFVITHTIDDPAMKGYAVARGKFLELRSITEGSARLLFETAALPGAPVPAFSPDSTLLVHQNGHNELGVVDCASGDSVDLIAIKLSLEDDDNDMDTSDDGYSTDETGRSENRRQVGIFGSEDEEWASGGEGGEGEGRGRDGDVERTGDSRSRRRRRILLARGGRAGIGGGRTSSFAYRHDPTMCSLRITPDGGKVQVGVRREDSVILEYALDDWHGPRHLRVGHEALSGSRVIDAPQGSGGLYAVLGPDRSVQIRSWRMTGNGKIGSGGISISSSSGSVGPNPAIAEREIARLRCGDFEKIEELAFGSTGEFFLTRDPGRGTASIWSIRPTARLIQMLEGVCSRATPEAFLLGGKAVALAHDDCTVKIYSCETGLILLTRNVSSPARSVAVVATAAEEYHLTLLAITGGIIHRWRLPADITTKGGSGRASTAAAGTSDHVTIVGPIRTAAAVPLPFLLPTPASSAATASAALCSKASTRSGGRYPVCVGDEEGRNERTQLVILAGERGLVAIDAARGRLVSEMVGHQGGVSYVAITSDGNTIISVGEDNVLIEWNAHTLVPKNRRHLNAEARALAVSPDSALVAVLAFDGAFVYEIGAPPETEELTSFGRDENVMSGYRRRDDPVQLAFWDNRTLAVALSRGRIQLRDVGPVRKMSMVSVLSTASSGSLATAVTADWIAHPGPVTCMAARPIGHTSGTAAVGSTRHRRRGSQIGGSLDLGRSSAVPSGTGVKSESRSGAVPDGANVLFARPPTLATGGGDGRVKVWTDEGRAGGDAEGLGGDAIGGTEDCAAGRVGRTGHEGAVLSICWHPQGEVLASAGQDWAIWLWDAEGRALSYVHSHRRWTQALSFSPSGDFLVSCGGVGFEGWLVNLGNGKQEAALCWRQPSKLVATMAELDGAINLAPTSATALRERGAIGEPSTAAVTIAFSSSTTVGSSVSGDVPAAICPVSGDAPTASIFPAIVTGALNNSRVVSFEPGEGEGEDGDIVVNRSHASIADADQSIDGGNHLIWPRGSDLEAKNAEGMTILALAARHGMGRMAEGLLTAGASVDAEDERGYTPLCWAAAGGYSTIVRALLFLGLDNDDNLFDLDGADPDHTTGKGDTPAILAAAGGHICVLAELEEAGADLDRGNYAGETPLIVASAGGWVGVVAFLAGLVGTDLDRRDAVEGFTALAAAVVNGQTENVRVLLARGADPCIPTTDGRTPTFLAASVDNLPALLLLLNAFGPDRKIETWRPDASGRTAIMAASANGHLECLRALVETDSDESASGLDVIRAKSRSTVTGPTTAPAWDGGKVGGFAGISNLAVLEMAARKHATSSGDIDDVDNEGRTALMHACMYDQPECVEYLLSNGARPEVGDEMDVTPLMLAAGGGNEDSLALLLDAVMDARHLDLADVQGKNASHYACISGEAGTLALLAGAGACLNLPSGRSDAGDAMHPAHLAVAHGSLDCLEELAAWDADLEATDGAGETVLSLAVQCGSESCAEFLLDGEGGERGTDQMPEFEPLVDPDRPGRAQEPPLHAAARRGKLFMLSLLLQAGANPAVKDRAGETALHAAAKFGQVDAIAVLNLQSGDRGEHKSIEHHRSGCATARRAGGGSGRTEPYSLDSWWSMTTKAGETATFLAAREGHVGVCRSLHEVGALHPSMANNDGVTPIMVAAVAGHQETVRLLLSVGGDVNQADARGRTLAMAAALRGDRPLLECLSEHGAHLSAVNSDGRTAAFFAAMNGHIDCLAFVIDECDGLNGVETADARDSIGCTPLWTAAAHGHLETVRYLTRRAASSNTRDITGTSAAWMTAGSGNAPCLGALLEAGADGNLANEDGLTPALIAAQGGHANCLRMLAAAGADLELRDFAGNSAAAFAAMGGHLGCLEVLEAGGASLDVPNSDGHTPVFAAITHRHLHCLQYLSKRGADLRRRDLAAGNTPAMVAASHGQTACLDFIVRVAGRRALSDTNDDGLSCACFAILCGREETLSSVCNMDPSCLAVTKFDSKKTSPAHCAASEGQLSCLRILADASLALAQPAAPTERDAAKRASLSSAPGNASGYSGGVGGTGNGNGEVSEVAAGAVAAVAEWFTGGRNARHDGAQCRRPFAGCIDVSGESPLHAAARAGHVDAFSFLVFEAGLKPEDRNARGETCLWLAAAYDRVDLLRIMIDKGLSVNTADTRGRSPAHAAAINNNVSALSVLLEACDGSSSPPSAPPNIRGSGTVSAGNRSVYLEARDADGATALHLAAAAGQLEAVEFLCDAGADIDACDGAGQTSVWRAAVDGKADVLDLLASRRANLNMHTQTGATLAHIVAHDGASGCLRVLCSHQRAKVDAINQAGNTPIMFAAMVNDVEGARLLAGRACDLSRRDIQSVTPAFFAAQEGNVGCLALLLSLGADGDIPRADGATPLIIAAQNGHESCVAILLDPPPFSSASTEHAPHGATAHAVRSSCAKLESRTSSGCTALCMAVIASEQGCVELLLSRGAEVDAADGKGRSPLYLAAAAGDTPMCSLLIRHGAKPRRKAPNGVEPSIAAAMRGHLATAKRIVRDARLQRESIADAAGVPLSRYLADLNTRRGSTAGASDMPEPGKCALGRPGDHGGRGSGGKRIAALLPASVARLRSSGRPIASPPAVRGIDDGGSSGSKGNGARRRVSGVDPDHRSPKNSRDKLPHSVPPRPVSSARVTKGGEGNGKSGSRPPTSRPRVQEQRRGYSSPSLATAPKVAEERDAGNRPLLRRTWSGVHGGESSAAAGLGTPGRRTPVPVGHRAEEASADGKRQATQTEAEAFDQQKGQQSQRQRKKQETKQPRERRSVLDRMTAFLFDVVDGK